MIKQKDVNFNGDKNASPQKMLTMQKCEHTRYFVTSLSRKAREHRGHGGHRGHERHAI